MESPTTLKKTRTFLGTFNDYCNLWPQRRNVFVSLTDEVGKSRFVWTPHMEEAFNKMKAFATSNVLNAFPNHNLPFAIFINPSDYQLGACIIQQGLPVLLIIQRN